jgi:hypothetical protein
MGLPITFVWPALAQIAHVKNMNVFLQKESRRASRLPQRKAASPANVMMGGSAQAASRGHQRASQPLAGSDAWLSLAAVGWAD